MKFRFCFIILILFSQILAQEYNSPEIPQISADDEVRFIIFGDSQFGNPSQYERMIYEANLLRPQFVIQVGDLINGYTHDEEQIRHEWKWFLNQISPLEMPFYPVPGNHDIVTDEEEKIYGEVWGENRNHYSFDYGAVHCIFLNSFHGEEDDRIAEWQYNWLKQDLAELSEKTQVIFVFVHSPLWKYPVDSPGYKDWEKVHKLLTQYPVKLVAGGHSHENIWEERDGINYIIINSAGVSKKIERDGMFSSFMHVSYVPGKEIKYANIKAGSILPIDCVTPKEREEIAKYKLADKNIRITNWNSDGEFETIIKVPLENKLDEARTFKLDWEMPENSAVKIIPESQWITLDSNAPSEISFHFIAGSLEDQKNLPVLEISAENKFRTGYVSRKDEVKLRQQTSTDKSQKSNILLDKLVTFEAKYTLSVPRQVTVLRKDSNIKIDGKVTDKEWKKYSELTDFVTSIEKPAEKTTTVKIAYDENYLYIGAILEEPNPDKMISTAHGEIPFTWNDDDLELFFDTRNNQQDYTRLFQTAHGLRFNSLERWVEDKYFESEYLSAIKIGKDRWSIEMQIPWKDIGIDNGPKSGDQWGFNISRNRPQNEVKESHWAGNPYNPTGYGILDFE
ncbi:MAG: metallophosphoesterase [Candidatus Marinimicrobia bacterium]|nr:metallophosphoesterase [Candidatus Neomarinimicrobiota bacterium]